MSKIISKKAAPLKHSSKTQFLRIFIFIVIFIAFTLLVYQRTLAKVSNYAGFADINFNNSISLITSKLSNIANELHVVPHAVTYNEQNKANKQILKSVEQLHERVTSSLGWISSMQPKNNNYPLIRWDLLSNAEVHILHKLGAYISNVLKSDNAEEQLANLVNKGYQCTASQAVQQEIISKKISMDICSEIEWYKVVQLAWPEARTFMDIGGNKGYLGSLFVALWGGGGLELAPVTVFNLATQLRSWKDSRNPAGYCRDGYSYGIPLFCEGNRDAITGQCDNVNEDVRVTSIDGSSYLKQTLSDIINKEIPNSKKDVSLGGGKVRNMWRYLNFAMSDQKGTVRFTKQDKDNNAGFEGGSIKSSSDASPATEEVNMTSVDLFMLENRMNKLDLLKIDTEGNDNKVLLGAKKAIQDHLGMFTFEGGKGITLSSAMLSEYDALGFSCYSTSRAGLFKWTGGCMKEQYMGDFHAKDKGNIFCVSRKRAPMATFAYDILSFPSLIEEYVRSDSGDANSKATLKAKLANVESAEQIVANELMPAYINIKPFCSPWPSCAKV